MRGRRSRYRASSVGATPGGHNSLSVDDELPVTPSEARASGRDIPFFSSSSVPASAVQTPASLPPRPHSMSAMDRQVKYLE